MKIKHTTLGYYLSIELGSTFPTVESHLAGVAQAAPVLFFGDGATVTGHSGGKPGAWRWILDSADMVNGGALGHFR